MSVHIDAQQIRRWQSEVAGDPGSPAFLPLAEVYRREGRLDVARRLCLRGLERNPEHVEAHYLLGRIYRELGDLERAFDEWDITLRLDPEHFHARRALGYLCLERREWGPAIRHLERAIATNPADERVANALGLARRYAAAERDAAPADEATLAQRLVEPLDRFVREARVRLALLLDTSGRIVAQHGFSRELDLAAFATLGAGIHAASGALAQMLGQPRFEQLYQGAGERQLFLGPCATPGGELILVTVFGGDTNIGLVRVLFQAFVAEVAALPWRLSAGERRVDAAAFEAELSSGIERALGGGDRPHLLR